MTPAERREWFIPPEWANPENLPRCLACRRAVTGPEWRDGHCAKSDSGHVLTDAQLLTLPYVPLEIEERGNG